MSAAANPSRRAFLLGRAKPAAAQAADIFIGPACFAERGVVCQTCGDCCETAAIRFRPRLGAPPAPTLDREACTLCGECAAACPAGAIVIAAEVARDG